MRKILRETILEILGIISGIFGFILILISTFFPFNFPWVTFQHSRVIYVPAPKLQWIFYQISPLLINVHVQDEIKHHLWFYKNSMTLIGLISFIGAITSLIGLLRKRRKITFVGLSFVNFSLIAFGTSLPGVYPYFNWGVGIKLTFYGSLLMFTSTIIFYIKENLQKNRFLYEKLLESWK